MMKRVLRVINNIEELFIGYALLGLAVIATIQVVLRYAFGMAYDWVDEGSRYMIVLITFMGAAVCVKYGTHFGMDALVQYVPNRVKHLLKVAANLISAFIMFVIFYYSWIQIWKLSQFGATTPSLQIPMFIPYLPIGICTLVIACRFLIQAFKHGRCLVHNSPFQTRPGVH
ncbi:MAG: TRAP transporter small permease [Desulfobacterium sp.]